MKKTFFLSFLIIIVSCESNEDSITGENNGNTNETFSIELSANDNPVIDEVVAVTVNSPEPMTSLEISYDNFQTSTTSFSSLGNSTQRYFSFDKLGDNTTIYFKAINDDGEESIQTYSPTISRGNALKIKSVEVISFSNIDGTWDSEFPNTNPNHLADVFFNLRKPQVSITTGNLSFQDWFTSAIKDNQGNLTWDVSSEDLYLDPQLSLLFSLVDNDGEFSEDLMLGPPFEREITFAEHITNQPNTITLSVPDIDLEVVLTVEWN